MTLPPNRIGDKGQRFQVDCLDYPNEGWNVIGWSNDLEGAGQMADAIQLAPTAQESRIIDRLKESVFGSLNNAKENGYDFSREDSKKVIADLTMYDADLEDKSPDDILPLVQRWQAEQAAMEELRHE